MMNRRVHSLFLLLVLALATFVNPAPLHAGSKVVSDDLIYDNVRRKLATDDEVKGGGLEVEVKDGAVVLKGQVDSERKKGKAERLAKKVGGVKSVDNEIKVVLK